MSESMYTSILISPEEAQKTGCFTTLPIRLHTRDDLANEATDKFVKDWARCIGDGRERTTFFSYSPVGSWASLLIPEAFSERIGILAYLFDLGLIQDDIEEELTVDEADKAGKDLSKALNPSDSRILLEGSKSMRLKELVSEGMLECIRLDRELGLAMLDAYRDLWLEIAENHTKEVTNNLEDYRRQRMSNGGMRVFWPMIAFGTGLVMTEEQNKLCEPVIEAATTALLLANDYFSYEREVWELETGKTQRMVSALEVLTRTQNMTPAEAKAETKRMIIEAEQDLLNHRDRLTAMYPEDKDLARWIEYAILGTAGNHYWLSATPRQNAWQSDVVTSRAHGGTIETRTDTVPGDGSEITEDGNTPNTSDGNDSDIGSQNTNGTAETLVEQSAKIVIANRADSVVGESDQWDKPDAKGIEIPAIDDISTDVVKSEDLAAAGAAANGGAAAKGDATNGLHTSGTIIHDFELNGSVSNGATKSQISEFLGVKSASPELSDLALSAPSSYILSMPAKGVRSSFIDALNVWLQVPEAPLGHISSVINVLHNASLILDDIEDESPLRRGRPATHKIFGKAQSINSATYMFVHATSIVQQNLTPSALTALIQELEVLFRGQSWDLYWRQNLICPSEREYISMIDQKTGGMFFMLLRLMQAESKSVHADNLPDLSRLTKLLGRFFQIRDDYMNLTEYANQKGFGEDLDEGKFSFPIVHCLQHHPEYRGQILSVFRQQSTNEVQRGSTLSLEVKKYLIDCLQSSGTLRWTLEYLALLEQELDSEIDLLEANFNKTNSQLRLCLVKLSVRQLL